MKHTMTDLYQMQGMPLEAKIEMTKRRIRDWVEYWGEDGVYVSFSGGKDSTVLLDIVRQDYPNIKAVFVDTGLEYPEVRDFVRTFDNVEWLRPKMTFKKVIEQYGYPFISKEVSECVYGARKYLTSLRESGIIDRPTDRPWRYAYERVTGTGAFAKHGSVAPGQQAASRGVPGSQGPGKRRPGSANGNGAGHPDKGTRDKGEYP